MKQTETYQLNLIENTDAFSPEPINANTRAIEGKLLELTGAAVKVAMGTYPGDGTLGASHPTTLTLEFQPKFLLVWGDSNYVMLGARGEQLRLNSGSTCTLQVTTWEGGTVAWYNAYTSGSEWQMNRANVTYRYLAIG